MFIAVNYPTLNDAWKDYLAGILTEREMGDFCIAYIDSGKTKDEQMSRAVECDMLWDTIA